jgi:hypothetical protein
VAFQMSRIDKRQRTYAVADNLGGTYTAVDLALLPVGANPTAATVWTSVPYASGVATVVWAGPDADSSGAIAVPGTAQLWIKGTNAPYVQAVKDERITVLGAANLTSPYVFTQALIGLDTDGTPYYDPGGIGIPAALSLDTDGVLYFTP